MKKRIYYKGRKVSKGEKSIIDILLKYKIKFEQEKTFDKCRSNKNYMLRFDFFLPEYNLLIEYDGEHHFAPVNKYRKAKIVHNKTVKNDAVKNKFVEKYNINFLRIPHWEYNNVFEIVKNKITEIIGE